MGRESNERRVEFKLVSITHSNTNPPLRIPWYMGFTQNTLFFMGSFLLIETLKYHRIAVAVLFSR